MIIGQTLYYNTHQVFPIIIKFLVPYCTTQKLLIRVIKCQVVLQTEPVLYLYPYCSFSSQVAPSTFWCGTFASATSTRVSSSGCIRCSATHLKLQSSSLAPILTRWAIELIKALSS